MNNTDSIKNRNSLITLGLLLMVVAVMTISPVSGEDIGWHLVTGDYLIKNHAMPPGDVLAHTVAPGTNFVSTQWAYQVLVAFLYQVGGWNALILLRVLCTMAIAAVLWLWSRDREIPLLPRLLGVATVMLGLKWRLYERPELFGYLFLAISLREWDGALRGRPLRLWRMLLLQLVWANVHTSCVLGVAGAFWYTVVRGWQLWRGKQSTSTADNGVETQGKHRWAVLLYPVAALGVTLLNPSGFGVLTYGFLEGSKKYIIEFLPPTAIVWYKGWGFIVLLAFIGLWPWRSPAGVFNLGTVSVFFLQSLQMIRFLANFAVASALSIAKGWTTVLAYSGRGNRMRRLVAILFIAYLVKIFFTIAWSERERLGRVGADFGIYPVGPAEFVMRERPPGKLFNMFNDGGYLLWRLYPDYPVFIFNETRLNNRILEAQVSLKKASDVQKFVEGNGATLAIIPYDYTKTPLNQFSLADCFRAMQDWALVYWNDQGMVWIKRLPENADFIRKFECVILPERLPSPDNRRANGKELLELRKDPEKWQKAGRELERLAKETDRTFRAIMGLAIWHDANGSTPTVTLAAYKKAEQISPDLPELLNRLGQFHMRQGDKENALAYFNRALRFSASRAAALYNLAVAKYQLGLYADAVDLAERMVRLDPTNLPGRKLREKARNAAARKPTTITAPETTATVEGEVGL